MKFRNIFYIILMIFFIIISYFFIDRGINAKTKVFVNYKIDSNVVYDIHTFSEYSKTNNISSDLIDYILFNFDYKMSFSTNVNGSYSYYIYGNVVCYENDLTNVVWQKRYRLLDDVVFVVDRTNVDSISVNDKVLIDYDKYVLYFNECSTHYDNDVLGYLELYLVIKENLDFGVIDNLITDVKNVKVIVPLNTDKFEITILDANESGKYFDFIRQQPVNYLLLILGIFNLSLGISFLVLVIRNIIIVLRKYSSSNLKLESILYEYNDIIVKVNKRFSINKYNCIYVRDFLELLHIYDDIGNPIIFKKLVNSNKALFMIISDDGDAWIYVMNFD